MTREETQKILLVILGAFANFKPEDINLTTNVWNDMLKDYDYNTVAIAVKSYIASETNGFAPNISQIIHEIQQLQGGITEISDSEAWVMVSKALRNSTYNAKEEFEKLPSDVQKAIGSSDQLYYWATDEHFNESVVSSNFLRVYRVITERSKKINRLPQSIKIGIQDTNRKEIGISD